MASHYPRHTRGEAAAILKAVADLMIAESWEADAPLTAVADERLRAGMREYEGHPDHWDGWTGERFAFNVLQEVFDASNYLCEALSRGERDGLVRALGLRP